MYDAHWYTVFYCTYNTIHDIYILYLLIDPAPPHTCLPPPYLSLTEGRNYASLGDYLQSLHSARYPAGAR